LFVIRSSLRASTAFFPRARAGSGKFPTVLETLGCNLVLLPHLVPFFISPLSLKVVCLSYLSSDCQRPFYVVAMPFRLVFPSSVRSSELFLLHHPRDVSWASYVYSCAGPPCYRSLWALFLFGVSFPQLRHWSTLLSLLFSFFPTFFPLRPSTFDGSGAIFGAPGRDHSRNLNSDVFSFSLPLRDREIFSIRSGRFLGLTCNAVSFMTSRIPPMSNAK